MPSNDNTSDPTSASPQKRSRRVQNELPESLDRERALDREEASLILGDAVVTLDQRRYRGEGPPFFRIGRAIRYRLGDVLAYRDARTVGKMAAK